LATANIDFYVGTSDGTDVRTETFNINSPQTISWSASLYGLETFGSTAISSRFRLKRPDGSVAVERTRDSGERGNYSGSYSISSTGSWTIEIRNTYAYDMTVNQSFSASAVYTLDSTPPTLGSVYVNDYREYTNSIYWVGLNESLSIAYEGHDETDISSGDSYLRALPSTGNDARINGVSNGSAINNEWITHADIDLNGGGSPVIQTINSGELQTEYYPKLTTHGVTHTMQGYLRDNMDNAYGYFDLGKTIGCDGNAPSLSSWNLTGYTYDDGTTYWGQPNDTMTFTHKGYDADSGAWRGYIRLQRTDNSDEEIASYEHSSGYNADSREDGNIDVTTARENSYDGHYMEVEFDFTLGSSDMVYDLGWYWYDACYNGSGYTETGRKVGIDGTAPNISVDTSSRGWDNTDVNVTINASDTNSGLSTLKYAWSTSTTTPSSWTTINSGTSVGQSSEGQWYLHVQATDNVGNTNTTYYGTYNIDKTAPTISFLYTSRDWGNTGFDFGSDHSDNLSGVATAKWQLTQSTSKPTSWREDTSPSQTGTVNSDDYSIGDGEWYYHIEITDNAGNSNYDYTGTFKVDKTSPSVSWNMTSSSWSSTVPSVTATNSDSLSGLSTAEYAVTNSTTTPTSWSTDTTPATTYFENTLSSKGDGEWYCHIKLTDVAGNVLTDYTGAYQIDTIQPTVSYDITSRTYDNTEVNVNLTYSDNTSGVANKKYAWTQSTATPTTWTDFTGNPVTISDTGEWYLHTKVIDYANNEYTTYEGTYNIDKMQPTTSYSTQSRDWGSSNVSVDLTFSDEGGAGLSTTQYKWSTNTTTPSSWNTWSSNPVTQSNSGVWYLHTKAVDNAGNELVTYQGEYRVDKLNPTLSNNNFSINSPTDIYATYTATVNWDCSDANSGIAYTALGLYIDGTWYYENTNLPSGVSCSETDMSHITGTSNSITFSGLPREVDINISWQVYDAVGNTTGEITGTQITTPRIINTQTIDYPTIYDLGLYKSNKYNSTYNIGLDGNSISETIYNIGYTNQYNHYFSIYTTNVLDKFKHFNSLFNIGLLQEVSQANTSIEIGLKNISQSNSKYEIFALKDDIEEIKGKYGKAFRLHNKSLTIPYDLTGDYTIRVIRNELENFDGWKDITIRSDGNTYVDGQLDNDYNTDWLGLEGTTNIITNTDLDTGWSKGYTKNIKFNDCRPPVANASVVSFNNDDTGDAGYWYSYGDYVPQEDGTTYTVSLWVKTDQDDDVSIRFYTADNSEEDRYNSEYRKVNKSDGWKKIVWDSFTTANPTDSDSLSFRFYNLYDSTLDRYSRLWLSAPQMESKEHATAYTPNTRQDGIIEINNYAWEIDEIIIIPSLVSEQEILEWQNKDIYFYSDESKEDNTNPSNVNTQLL